MRTQIHLDLKQAYQSIQDQFVQRSSSKTGSSKTSPSNDKSIQDQIVKTG